jgi:hypothetical protein
MPRSVDEPKVWESLIARLMRGEELRVIFIDPGTNCAMRMAKIVVAGGQMTMKCVANVVFKGTGTGTSPEARFSMLALELEKTRFFQANLYLIEKQFENNVEFISGILMGMLCARRTAEASAVVREKRGGNLTIDELPWAFYTIPQKWRKELIGKCPKEALKARAIETAKSYCMHIGDIAGHELLTSLAKADDLGDAICYEAAFYTHLRASLTVPA